MPWRCLFFKGLAVKGCFKESALSKMPVQTDAVETAVPEDPTPAGGAPSVDTKAT